LARGEESLIEGDEWGVQRARKVEIASVVGGQANRKRELHDWHRRDVHPLDAYTHSKLESPQDRFALGRVPHNLRSCDAR
jgi:hypothetical protein